MALDGTANGTPAAGGPDRAAAIAAHRRPAGRGVATLPLISPSVVLLLIWTIVPLGMTLYFSMIRYNLLNPAIGGFAGLNNYRLLLTDPAFWTALVNTLILVGSVLAITVVLGLLLAVLFNRAFYGRGIARVLAISPFFVMPTVSALIWKNMMMHPVNGFIAWVTRNLGLGTIDWFADVPLLAIIIIVAWQWIPFALLILLTGLQSLSHEVHDAARIDGAGPIALFRYITLPHLGRAIAVVIMIETIFLLTVFAEIRITTGGGPGIETTNLAFLIYVRALLEYSVGGASAGGIIAVILANIVAFFLVRVVSRNLKAEQR